jgi:ParB-like chromosome segregation protein Spo0J
MPTKKSEVFMRIDEIEATQATQVRKKIHKDIVEMYQADIEAGAKMPPVAVFREVDSSRTILADGFHRLLAAVNAGKEEIEVEIRGGGMHQALLYALSANQLHGLRRSNADKVHAVEMALRDPEISQHTQAEIADICGVSRTTVQRCGQKQKPDENVSKTQSPEPNTPENNRPTKPEPTQDEIDRGEVRQAMALIKALPYPGDQAKKLGFDPDDLADIEYAATWLSHLVMEIRNGAD